jgi:hypothetical protein
MAKTERILIHTDTDGVADFRQAVTDTKNRCENLISIFQSFQEWRTIETLTEFENLCNNPLQYFDDVLLLNIDLKVTGNKKPAPDGLASLLGIDRTNYQNLIQGLHVTEGCSDCRKTKMTIRGEPVLTASQYDRHKDFLLFDNGTFSLNNKAIAEYNERFKIFAETPGQIELYNHYQSILKILQQHEKLQLIGPANMEQVTKLLGGCKYVNGKLYPADDLHAKILKIQ